MVSVLGKAPEPLAVRFTARRFRIAVLVLTLAAFAVTGLSAQTGPQTVWTYLAFGYAAAVLANVFVPHVAVSIATRTYMPGLGTAVLLNLPALSLVLISALKEGYVLGWKAVEYSLGVAGFLVLAIVCLFRFGAWLEEPIPL